MILRALAYTAFVFLWAALIAVALVSFGCAAPRDGWLDWWRADQSIPAPPMGESVPAPEYWIDLGPLPEPVPLAWDGEAFESMLEGENE